jgi:hypothetical protein
MIKSSNFDGKVDIWQNWFSKSWCLVGRECPNSCADHLGASGTGTAGLDHLNTGYRKANYFFGGALRK